MRSAYDVARPGMTASPTGSEVAGATESAVRAGHFLSSSVVFSLNVVLSHALIQPSQPRSAGFYKPLACWLSAWHPAVIGAPYTPVAPPNTANGTPPLR